MQKHLKTIFMLLPLLLCYLLLQLALGHGKATKALSLAVPEKIGIDEELQGKIDQLEQDITRRLNYEVELARDPLKLSAVLKVGGTKRNKEFTERHRALRLSATILSPAGNTAIIKHRSKSYAVQEGDVVQGWTVKSVGKKEVLLGGVKGHKILKNRPAPKIEAVYDKKKEDEGLKL